MKMRKLFCFMVFVFVVIAIIGLVNTLADSCRLAIQKEAFQINNNDFQINNSGSNEGRMIDAPFIGQMELYPTGCESTSTNTFLNTSWVKTSFTCFAILED